MLNETILGEFEPSATVESQRNELFGMAGFPSVYFFWVKLNGFRFTRTPMELSLFEGVDGIALNIINAKTSSGSVDGDYFLHIISGQILVRCKERSL